MTEGEARSATTKVSREHTVVSPVPGLVLIAGGKLTTYRVMARDAVDLAVDGWVGVAPSQTERVPLLGADDFITRTNQRVSLSRLQRTPAGSAGLTLALVDPPTFT